MSNKKQLKFEVVGDCKICISHKPHENGFIRVTKNGVTKRLHRVIWEKEVGKIPDGYEISHTCNDKRCMNVNHMECITTKERGEKMSKRGTSLRGTRSPQAKLTEQDVVEIVNNKGDSYSLLSEKYGVTEQHIYDLKRKKYWKHLWNGGESNDNVTKSES